MTTWYSQSDSDWSSAVWNDAQDGSGSSGEPVDGDTADINGHAISISGTVQFDGAIVDGLGGGSLTLDGTLGADGATLTLRVVPTINVGATLRSLQLTGVIAMPATIGSYSIACPAVTLPTADQMIVGATAGPGGNISGDVVLPDASAVQTGVQYGPHSNTTGAYTGGGPTAAQIATAVWEDLLDGGDFGTAGSIGALLLAKIDAAISSRAAVGSQMDLVNAPNATAITAIQSGLAVASALASAITTIEAGCASASQASSILAALDTLTGTIAEPAAGNHPVTPTLLQAVAYLYLALMNDNTAVGGASPSRTLVNHAGTTLCQATPAWDSATQTMSQGAMN